MAQLAKLARPSVSEVYHRKRLYRALEGPSQRRAVWVSGPPGSGKTTLLAGYVESRGKRVLWDQLDTGDRDPATFFHYLSRGAGVMAPRARLPAFGPEVQSDPDGFSRRFFRALFAALGRSPMVIFDDLHELGEGSPVYALLAVGLEEIPSGGRTRRSMAPRTPSVRRSPAPRCSSPSFLTG
jgi:ATP/maltotriose-dependent transcriptional regulator MalT